MDISMVMSVIERLYEAKEWDFLGEVYVRAGNPIYSNFILVYMHTITIQHILK